MKMSTLRGWQGSADDGVVPQTGDKQHSAAAEQHKHMTTHTYVYAAFPTLQKLTSPISTMYAMLKLSFL